MYRLWMCLTVCVLSTLHCHGNRLGEFSKPEDYMETCMRGVSHKQKPGPESNLFNLCEPWKDRSCCTEEIANSLHVNTTWYKMDYNHCDRPMSEKCRARFTQDLCFYECSPNIGPWLVKVENMKIREERFVNVPLCQNECNAWWEDCIDDYTCVENWSRHFNWSTGFPKCPVSSECKTFRDVYKNSTNFCEKVFDHSWKVVEDTDPEGCFVMWWNTGEKNPNYDIALRKAQFLVSSANTLIIDHVIHIVLFTIAVLMCVKL